MLKTELRQVIINWVGEQKNIASHSCFCKSLTSCSVYTEIFIPHLKICSVSITFYICLVSSWRTWVGWRKEWIVAFKVASNPPSDQWAVARHEWHQIWLSIRTNVFIFVKRITKNGKKLQKTIERTRGLDGNKKKSTYIILKNLYFLSDYTVFV